jgi:malate dehydrogenase (oxaloacetate-decarboxylating)
LTEIRRVAAEIAVAVGIQAQKDEVSPKVGENDLSQRVLKTQGTPVYAALG